MKFKSLRLLLRLGMLAGISFSYHAEAATFLIDFGLNNAAGSQTASPDTNGSYWNNVYSDNAAGTGNTGNGTSNGLSNLVNTANVASTISLALSSGTQPWSASGGTGFGGLITPNPALLGNLAIGTATQDYFFVGSAGTATIAIGGLNPSLTYNFRMFGTRNTAATRTTAYTITDNLGPHVITLQTSGTGIGTNTAVYPTGQPDGNDDEIVSLNGMVPTSLGTLNLGLSNVAGDFSYLGVMEITSVPESGTALLTGLAGIGFAFIRSRRRP